MTVKNSFISLLLISILHGICIQVCLFTIWYSLYSEWANNYFILRFVLPYVAFNITASFVVVDFSYPLSYAVHTTVLSDAVTFSSFSCQMYIGMRLSSFLLLEQNWSACVFDEGGDLLQKILQGSLILFNSENTDTLGR